MLSCGPAPGSLFPLEDGSLVNRLLSKNCTVDAYTELHA